MRTKYAEAKFAVLGTAANGEHGVLAWHDEDSSAFAESREINLAGGRCRVVSAPKGKLTREQKAEVFGGVVGDSVVSI